MMRFCPNCATERPLDEIFCGGTVNGRTCGWDLSEVPIKEKGWRPAPAPIMPQTRLTSGVVCVNGHPVEDGDLICLVCGADIAETSGQETVIDGWRLLKRLRAEQKSAEYYEAVRSDGAKSLMTLYAAGAEPDIRVYEAIKKLDRKFVPEIMAAGRWNDRAYEASECLSGKTLADAGCILKGEEDLKHMVKELGEALNALSEAGIRHRNLSPSALFIRSMEPFDLVIGRFGSASLSECDLDTVSTLAADRYTAPEAVIGVVSAASDWWSLGIIVLEQLSGGKYFENVNEKAFIIKMFTEGVPIPGEIPPYPATLLKGLLHKDHRKRWQWKQVKAWLEGNPFALVSDAAEIYGDDYSGKTIALNNKQFARAELFALAAGAEENWDRALEMLLKGDIATWLEEISFEKSKLELIAKISKNRDIDDNFKLSFTLKLLNGNMPFLYKGDIITPGWLLRYPVSGHHLIAGAASVFIKDTEPDGWIDKLHRRVEAIRQKAFTLGIELDEERLKIYILATSNAQLASQAKELKRHFPDSENAGLFSLLEKELVNQEDFIILLSACAEQFRNVSQVIKDAAETAAKAGISTFDAEAAGKLLESPYRELYKKVASNTEKFLICGIKEVDGWIDEFRITRKMPLARLLAVLSMPRDCWTIPEKHYYKRKILDFFSKKVINSTLKGPLVRMRIGKTTPRADICDYAFCGLPEDGRVSDGAARPAGALIPAYKIIDAILSKSKNYTVLRHNSLQARIRLDILDGSNKMFKRETGIDGLYLGFPFLVYREPSGQKRPYIAPLFLWPVKIKGGRSALDPKLVSFDSERAEIRLNPVLETMTGKKLYGEIKKVFDELVCASVLGFREVLESLKKVLESGIRENGTGEIVPVPSDPDIAAATGYLYPSAALFQMTYMGQAIEEDIQKLKRETFSQTAAQKVLKLDQRQNEDGNDAARAENGISEKDKFFILPSDPSQEKAVFTAERNKGLLIEGPPGTGKSQTIVNMIANSIGKGKTVLVVCQKLAALEVVYKRLEAEGLASRAVMTDAGKSSRAEILKSIRRQLETLPYGSYDSSKRERLASFIDETEEKLNMHNKALHTPERVSGYTYREIICALIELEKDGMPLSLPFIKDAVGKLKPDAARRIKDEIASIIDLWLKSDCHNSPFDALNAEIFRAGAAENFKYFLNGLLAREKDYRAYLDANSEAAELSARPEVYQDWIAENKEKLLSLTQEELDDCGRFACMFTENDQGQELISALEAAKDGLRNAEINGYNQDFYEELAALDDPWLELFAGQAKLLCSPKPWYAFLSIKRFIAGKSIKKRFGAHNKGSETLFYGIVYKALSFEQTLRPLRRSVVFVCRHTGENVPSGGRPQDFYETASSCLGKLNRAKHVCGIIGGFPDMQTVLTAVRNKKLEKMFSDYEAAFEKFYLNEKRKKAFSRASGYFCADLKAACLKNIESYRSVCREICEMGKEIEKLPYYLSYKKRKDALGAASRVILEKMETVRESIARVPEEKLADGISKAFMREVYLNWLENLISEYPLLNAESSFFRQQIENLEKADEQMRLCNKEFLKHALSFSAGGKFKWESITRISGARALRMREFAAIGIKEGLLKLRPVWLLTPDAASRILPLKAGLFDIVIYDEASQMPVEYALPSLFRAKELVVSGDEKQMPPSSFFSGNYDVCEDDGADAEELAQSDELTQKWDAVDITGCPDLLQLSREVLDRVTLQVHYRSKFRELIAYSNAAFYNNRLHVPSGHSREEIIKCKPVEFVEVDGIYHEQSNRDEAKKVVELLDGLWKNSPSPRPSIGVVTFNQKQAAVINEYLNAYARLNESFRKAYNEESSRKDSFGEDMSFFVKNVENVQGDERDIIIFSTTFGYNKAGMFRRNFGVLGQTGGERRLNVAVTRAKHKVLVVTSMPVRKVSDFLDISHPPSSPRDYIQAYLEYARLISSNDFESAQALINRRNFSGEFAGAASESFRGSDIFENEVGKFLDALSVKYDKKAGGDLFALDFAVIDQSTGKYVLGIECDAPVHELLASARAREIWRPRVIKKTVPEILRVSSRQWYADRKAERKKIENAVSSALSKEM